MYKVGRGIKLTSKFLFIMIVYVHSITFSIQYIYSMPHMATTRTHRKWSANEKVCAFVFAMIGSILSVTFQRQTCHRLPVYTSSSSTRPPKKQPLIEDEADLDSSRVAPSSSTSWHGRYMPRMKMTENRSCNCEERHREKHD